MKLIFILNFALLVAHKECSCIQLSPPDSIYPRQLISGVYSEKLPSPVYYDTFVPIIYEYQLPEWNKSEVTFNNWYTCISESSPYKYTCPTVFHMNKAIMNLHIDFESLLPVQDTLPHTEYYETLFQTSTFCDTIQKHFSGIFIQQDELNNYIEILKKCHQNLDYTGNTGDLPSSAFIHLERSLNDYNYSIRAPFSKMENNYYNSFYRIMNNNNSLDLVASATLSNARTTIQAILLSAYYAEKYRWFHALQDCQLQRLPHSMVTLKKLNQTLMEIAKDPSFNSKYNFSIPLELISKYYSLPLSDCTYTSNSFVVRLLFPVKLKGSNYNDFTLYKLRQVPFHYEYKLCHVELSTEVEQNILYDSSTQLAYSTVWQPNTLCQVSELLQANHIDHCATGIVTNNFTATKDNCDFECRDASNKTLVIGLVTRADSSKFIVVSSNNQSTITAKYRTANRIYAQQQQIKLVNYGALEITLPCKSQLILDKKVYSAEHPCNESTTTSWTPTIKHVEPWHFHFSDKIRENETSSDPFVVHYYLIKKAIYLQHSISLDDSIADTLNNPEEGAGSPMLASAHTGGDTIGDKSHGLLWAVLIFSVVILLAIQLYIIYEIRLIKASNASGGSSRVQSIMMNLRNRSNDPEPEFRLLNNDQQQ